MARLGFNDGSGFVYLRSAFPAPGDRFQGFTPDFTPIGDEATALGNGVTDMWTFRNQYTASFALGGIPAQFIDGESGTNRAQRFVRWVRLGGAFEVDVEDEVGTLPVLSRRAPGTTVSLELEDRKSMLYRVSLVAMNLVTPYRAVYGGILP